MNARIVIEVPAVLKDLVKPVQELFSFVSTQTRAATSGRAIDYGTVERELRTRLAATECAAHRVMLSALEIDAPHVEIGGKLFTRVARGVGTYYSMAGAVDVPLRGLYRLDGCRNAKTVDVISLRTGAVGRGWLPEAASAMAHLLQQGTQREAEQTARRLGCLPYSRPSFDRLAHEVGEAWHAQHADIEDVLIQELEIPKAARSVSVALDRVSVPMEEPAPRPVGRPRKGTPKQPITRAFRMAYCGTVTLHDKDGTSLHTIRRGCMPNGNPKLLCQSMANDVLRMIEKQPRLKMMLLADGAPEMWNLLEDAFAPELFGSVNRSVDFWHLIEKLYPAAAAIHGTEAAGTVVGDWKRILCERPDGAKAILRSLELSGREHTKVAGKQPVHEAITYLRNNGERMDYRSAREQGLPIGSGNVEATCKTLVGIRMKRCGSRWKEQTGGHILQLRALALSDWYDVALDKLFARRRTAVRRAA
jgi:hypothetical protein